MEANNLFVVYRDLRAEGSRDEGPAERIRELGTAIPLLPGAWLVKSDFEGAEAFQLLAKGLQPQQALLVVDATNDSFHCWPEPPGIVPGGPSS